MKTTLQHLASQYLKTSASQGIAKKGYCDFDFLHFIKKAKVSDGDSLATTLRELRITAQLAPDHIQLRWVKYADKDHTHPQVIRLMLPEGEQWLFDQIDETSPSHQRQLLAATFDKALAAHTPYPIHQRAWASYVATLSDRTLKGESITPFHKDSIEKTEELLQATSAILSWTGDSLIRYASAQICGNSKRLQTLEKPLTSILCNLLGKEVTLSDFGIHQKPRQVMFHGPLKLQLGDVIMDFTPLSGATTLSETTLIKSTSITTSANYCITVENEDVFYELAQRNPGILIIHTSYPGSAVVRLLNALPREISYLHYGDTDPAGFDILHTLRIKTNATHLPFLMHYCPAEESVLNRFNDKDASILEKLISSDIMSDVLPELLQIKQHGNKGRFEQEHIAINIVMAELNKCLI